MDDDSEEMLLAFKVRVRRPRLVSQGTVDSRTVMLVTRLLLREILRDVTGGIPDIELGVYGFTEPEYTD